MSAANALRAARDAGIGLHVDGVDLVLEASAPPPPPSSICWPATRRT